LPNTGKKRHRLSVQSLSQSSGSEGGLVDTWTTVFTRWASIRPLRGDERFVSEQEHGQLSHEIRMRYDENTSTITNKHRLLKGSRIFDIQSYINVFEREREIVFTCIERVD